MSDEIHDKTTTAENNVKKKIQKNKCVKMLLRVKLE